MRKLSMVLSVAFLVAAAGCRDEGNGNDNDNAASQNVNSGGNANTAGNDNSGGAGGTQQEQGVASLSRFDSAQELEEYFKGQILDRNSRFAYAAEDGDFFDAGADGNGDGELTGGGEGEGEGEAIAEPPVADTGSQAAADGDENAGDNFSGTTIQEEGVDEADVVKTDGEYFYILSGEELHIVRAVPPDAMELLSTVALDGWGRNLYLAGDRVVALTESYGEVFITDGGEGTGSGGGTDDAPPPDTAVIDEPRLQVDIEPAIAEPWYVPRPRSIVTVIDVTSKADPSMVTETAFDGTIASSRMIDGVLRLVLANYSDYYYDVLPLGAPEDELGLPDVNLDSLLPDFTTVDADGQVASGNIVEWDGFFRPTDPDGFGVTTVVTMDSAAPESFDAVAVVAQPGLIYSSTEALYLTDTEYYFDFRRIDTDIYKFAYTPNSVELVAAGTVSGRILNQYSMGEYEGYLRVATTTDQLFLWETGEQIPSENAVYVLGEDEGDLAIMGSVEGIAQGEQIQSARFLADRGYVVTFEQIDPFFTLDLSDPSNPIIVGELKIPGFSTFITPMDRDHLLTVGQYVDPEGFGFGQGVQMSIFDVTDFGDPKQVYNVIIGDEGTSSEATWDPKAFTYFASQDLVALPIDHYGGFFFEGVDFITDGAASTGDSGAEAVEFQADAPAFDDFEEFQGLYVYRVTAEEGFEYLGRISTRPDDQQYYWSSFTRGVFIDESVYAVTDRVVVSAPISAVDEVADSLVLPGQSDVVFGDEPVAASAPSE